MSVSKTILTKTVIGKGYKTSKQKNIVKLGHVSDSVLGCWILNHKYKGEKKDAYTEISGSYEVHLWYSYENGKQTAVISEQVSYTEHAQVRIFNELERRPDGESVVAVVNDPVCIDADIIEGGRSFEIVVEMSFLVRELAELYLTIETFQEEVTDFENELEEELRNIDLIVPEIFDEE